MRIDERLSLLESRLDGLEDSAAIRELVEELLLASAAPVAARAAAEPAPKLVVDQRTGNPRAVERLRRHRR